MLSTQSEYIETDKKISVNKTNGGSKNL